MSVKDLLRFNMETPTTLNSIDVMLKELNGYPNDNANSEMLSINGMDLFSSCEVIEQDGKQQWSKKLMWYKIIIISAYTLNGDYIEENNKSGKIILQSCNGKTIQFINSQLLLFGKGHQMLMYLTLTAM